MTGCSSRSTWSSTCPSTRRVTSLPAITGFVSSRYQSHTSSHAKWYSVSQTLASSYPSNSSSTSSITCCSRDSTHLSTVDSCSAAGSGPLVCAPFISAKRVAFHSLLQKLREPWHHSSDTGTSVPGFAPRASVNRVASAPNRSIHSSGSTTLPEDFDIFLPYWSRTMPCRATTSNGCVPCIAYRPNIIIRATQKNRMSYPVTSTLVG